jgi:hypothetical protein
VSAPGYPSPGAPHQYPGATPQYQGPSGPPRSAGVEIKVSYAARIGCAAAIGAVISRFGLYAISVFDS